MKWEREGLERYSIRVDNIHTLSWILCVCGNCGRHMDQRTLRFIIARMIKEMQEAFADESTFILSEKHAWKGLDGALCCGFYNKSLRCSENAS